jgi:copper transport protein
MAIRSILRIGSVGVGLAMLLLVLLPIAASAHALVSSSDPADGAILDQAPAAVTITFTEKPDPKLSGIQVLDSLGHQVDSGPTSQVPGNPVELTVPLGKIPDGVYTITWHTVSAVDGHRAGGILTFGVGVTPADLAAAPRPATSSITPPPSPLGVAGNWVFYVGLGLMLGGTWISLLAFRDVRRGLRRLAFAGALVSICGLLATAESTREGAGVDWRTLLSTSLGFNLLTQFAPVLAAAVLLGIAQLTTEAARLLLWITTGLVGVAILLHVLASHALSSGNPWLEVGAQFVHVAAFAVWIGGLAALLIGVRGLPSEDKAAAVRRFSRVAGYALGLVALSGLIRALDEVVSWSNLFRTLFGQLVLVKVGLLTGLAMLGAVNRFRNVPVVARSLDGLRRIGSVELSVAAVLLIFSAVLTSLAPPSFVRVQAAQSAPQVVIDSADFGTTTKAHLIVSPGLVGPNFFTLKLSDYDTGQPVDAEQVSMTFTLSARPTLGTSNLTLSRTGPGAYGARGLNLSFPGTWDLAATVETTVRTVEIPFRVEIKQPPPRVRTIVQPGQPTIYVIDQPDGGQTQAYVEPGTGGQDQIHLTYLDSSGQEEKLPDMPTVTATSASGAKPALTLIRFSQGHFIAQGTLSRGQWTFAADEAGPGGLEFTAQWSQTIG